MQELVDKAAIVSLCGSAAVLRVLIIELLSQLPKDIRWSFIGTLQSNKCKTLAGMHIFELV